jgi:hypothetical protein
MSGFFSPDELRVAFSIPSGSLFLVNHLVFSTSKCFEANPISKRLLKFIGIVMFPEDMDWLWRNLEMKENTCVNNLKELAVLCCVV